MLTTGFHALLAWLGERDVAFVLLSADPMEPGAAMAAAGLPAPPCGVGAFVNRSVHRAESVPVQQADHRVAA